jgi:hypothetical protein
LDSIDRLHDSDTERATTTDSSLHTRPSLLFAGAESPFTVSPHPNFINGYAVLGSELLIFIMPFFYVVALALREQVLAVGEVPVGANDVSVDMIVTPDETIAATGNPST